MAGLRWSRVRRPCRSAGGGGVPLPRVLGFPSALHRLPQTPPHGNGIKYDEICLPFLKRFDPTHVFLITGTFKGGVSLRHQGVFDITFHRFCILRIEYRWSWSLVLVYMAKPGVMLHISSRNLTKSSTHFPYIAWTLHKQAHTLHRNSSIGPLLCVSHPGFSLWKAQLWRQVRRGEQRAVQLARRTRGGQHRHSRQQDSVYCGLHKDPRWSVSIWWRGSLLLSSLSDPFSFASFHFTI